MRRLVVIFLYLTLGLLNSLSVVVEPTSQDPLTTSVNWSIFSVNSDPGDESEFPDETPISLLRVTAFGKSAPAPRVRRIGSRPLRTLPLRIKPHCSLHQDLFHREAVLRI